MARETSSDFSNGPVVVLSGPSGSGKTTVVERLVVESPVRLIKCISATTRPPRKGEVDGENYFFLSQEEFERRRQQDEFLECAEVHGSGYWYGTLKSEVKRAHDTGGWAFLEIDVAGALRIMDAYDDALTIFLKTPSSEEYERRLRTRGTESEAIIQRRLETARNELKCAHRYRYQVVNNELDLAVREICDILSTTKDEQNARRTERGRDRKESGRPV